MSNQLEHPQSFEHNSTRLKLSALAGVVEVWELVAQPVDLAEV
jgi:hypothetical protein